MLKKNWIIIVILLLGFILRIYKLDFQSVWLDEIHSLNESNPNYTWSQVFDSLLVSDPHPPLYFILLHLLFKVFGYTVWTLRFVSVLFGVAGIAGTYLLAKEMFNKRIAYYAALLIAVNHFQIYYSQEARMYAMLFFTSVMSFYFLLRFIKVPTYRTSLLYAVFAALMLYTHFFALFALAAQLLILLLWTISNETINELKSKLKFSLISTVMIFIFYLPVLPFFNAANNKTSMWIQYPEQDVYTQIIKEFFGKSEMVLFFVVPLILLYFLRVYSVKNEKSTLLNVFKDKGTSSFIVLMVWIFVTLLIPYVASFVKLPMIVSRYFIIILPAIILMVATGLSLIKNKSIQIIVLVAILFLSITDLVFVKQYYSVPNKTQFREATEFVKQNNPKNEKVVSSLGWYLPYFFQNQKVEIEDKPLDDYVLAMINNQSSIKSFWYFDGHIRPYSPNDQTKQFLEQNFIVDKSVDLYDCYVKHFTVKKDFKITVDLKGLNVNSPFSGDALRFNIESFSSENLKIQVKGWAVFENQDMANTKIQVIALNNENKAFALPTNAIQREDVTSYINSGFNLDQSGFEVSYSFDELPQGQYKLALILEDLKNKKKGMSITDKIFIKQ